MNTGIYDPYLVDIADARPLSPTLASHGFTLINHQSAVTDFTDANEVNRLYYAEADALIRRVTGADITIPFGWMLRTSGAAFDGAQPPAAEAHVDFTPERAKTVGDTFLVRDGHDPAMFSRHLIVSLWRCFSTPPQDWPLALCAGYSVRDDEGTPNLMIRTDTLPEREAALAPLENEEQYPAASVFHYSADHRWFTYPDMTRGEAIIVTFYDSARGANWRVPHTAFQDMRVASAVARKSIELRSIAYWNR
jgi:hypothetical protein